MAHALRLPHRYRKRHTLTKRDNAAPMHRQDMHNGLVVVITRQRLELEQECFQEDSCMGLTCELFGRICVTKQACESYSW